MKFSEAALKGMERFPRQAKDYFQVGNSAACIGGCFNWATSGDAFSRACFDHPAWFAFEEAYGVNPARANNEGILREDIVGMLQAIGH